MLKTRILKYCAIFLPVFAIFCDLVTDAEIELMEVSVLSYPMLLIVYLFIWMSGSITLPVSALKEDKSK